MTSWIGTGQVGWDANEIGFHSIQGCTGLVLRTDHWVAGWHLGGASGTHDYFGSGQTKISFQGPAFLNYIQTTIVPHSWPAAGLMAGTIKLWNIHNEHDGWKDELQDFADIIGYHGRTRGFDLRSKVGANTSCDALITKVGDNCTIKYKTTNKMTHTPQDLVQLGASDVRRLHGTPAIAPTTALLAGPESHSATVIHTQSNKGQMHTASRFCQRGHTV